MRVTRMPGRWDGPLSLKMESGGARAKMVADRQSSSPEPVPPTAGSGSAASGTRRDGPVPGPAGKTRRLRLTGRGAVVVILAASLAGTYVAEEFHTNSAAGIAYVAACAIAALYVKPGYLLVPLVAPPLLFAVAVICVKAATAGGSLLTATAEGTLLLLGASAPWLFGGTLLALIITVFRGLGRDIRQLSTGLRGDHGTR